MRKVIINILIGFSLGIGCAQVIYADDLPFPDASVGNYVFGVGSYYNAFAANKLTINSNPIDILEGRYAAKQIVSTVEGAPNDGKVWNKLSQFSPVYVANEVPYQSTDETLKANGQNLFNVFNKQDKLPDDDKIVINNLRYQAQNVWDTATKQKNSVLINHLADQNVGDVTYFKDNVPSLEADYQQQTGKNVSLDASKVDASDYFAAAAAQIRSISDYYASFNTKSATLANGGVAEVSVQQALSGTSPEVTIKLSDDYQKHFVDQPPMVFLDFSGQPQNVTINIENMDTSVVNNAVTSGTSYATYQYAPYIFVNWTGVTTKIPFTWGSAYKFSVTDQNNKVITNDQNNDVTNSDGSKASINQLLSSHILNNFPKATTAAGTYLNADIGDSSNLFTGSIMAPSASIQVSNMGDDQFFYGSIISGKDVLIENNMLPARVIASSFDVEHISSDSISDLDPNKPQVPQLTKVTLSQGSDGSNAQTVTGGATATYSAKHTAGAVKLSSGVTTKKTPYQLFYQLNDKSWQLANVSGIDATQATNTLDLGTLAALTGANQSQLSSMDNQTSQAADFDPTTLTTTTQTIAAELTRTNTLKMVVAPIKSVTGTAITVANVADYLGTYPPTNIKIVETGMATATLPTVFDFKLAQKTNLMTATPTVALTNDWQVPVSLTLGSSTGLSRVLSDGAQPLNTVADWLKYQVTIGSNTTSYQFGDTATTVLPATSPPSQNQQLGFSMTMDPADYPAKLQPGNRYYIPLHWELNYGLKIQ